MVSTLKYNKVWNKGLDLLGIFNVDTRIEAKVERSEEFLRWAVAMLAPDHNVYLAMVDSEERFGCTYPLFDESQIIPEGHMVLLSMPNLFVLTHEIAHILDYERKPSDNHDSTFMSIWANLLNKLYAG